MAEAGIGDTLRVFAQTIDGIIQTRFLRIETALANLENRLIALETGKPAPPLVLPPTMPIPSAGATLTHPMQLTVNTGTTHYMPAPGPTQDACDNDHSWYALSVEHPAAIEDKSPEHLVAIMYRIVDSKAINVSKYIASLRLDDTGKPILYMLLYVNRPSIQSHFIQRWNADEKGTVICRKLKRLELVIDEYRKLKIGHETPVLSTYRARYPGVFVGARWGSVTQEFIMEKATGS